MPANLQVTPIADGLPPGYRLRPDGIEVEAAVRGEGGKLTKEWRHLCSQLVVQALARNCHGEAWGRVVMVTDKDGVDHYWTMPASMLATNPREVVAHLMDIGLRTSLNSNDINLLVSLLNQWAPKKRAMSTTQLGWADDTCTTFVKGDGTAIGDEDVVLQSRSPGGPAAEMRSYGTLAAWRENVAALAIGNPVLLTAISVALAGPLLAPLQVDGGGIHLRGESSKGKTTALTTAASTWGSPAFRSTWRATGNGLEAIAAACNSTVLLLDEMSEINGRDAGETAYMLANGRGKARANVQGGARSSARWKMALISTGEIGLADKVAEAGRRPMAGQAVRLLDLHVTDRQFGVFDFLHGEATGDAFARRIALASAADYGHAGPAFVEWLLKDKEARLKAAVRLMEAFCADAARQTGEVDGQVQRAINRLAVFAAAGELASDAGITGWAQGAANMALLKMLEVWISGRGGKGSAEATDAVQRMQDFLLKHGDSRFETLASSSDGNPRTVVNRAGWRDNANYYVHSAAMAEVFEGANKKAGLKSLQMAGLLHSGDGKNLTCKLGGVPGRPRVYCIPREALGGENAETEPVVDLQSDAATEF